MTGCKKEEHYTWKLSGDTLIISGSDAMPDYDIYGDNYPPWYSNRALITSVIIEEGITTIGNFAFSGFSALSSVTIGNSVTSIGDYAFDVCSNLTSICIPYSVIFIGACAFRCCGFTEIIIPNSVVTIDNFAFQGCGELSSVIIGNSLEAATAGEVAGTL